MAFIKENTVESLEKAIEKLKKIPNWKNADELSQKAKERIVEIKAKEEEQERLRQIEIKKDTKKKKIVTLTSIVAILVVIAGVFGWIKVIIPSNMYKYSKAMSCISNGNYVEAGNLLVELGDYKDSKEQYQSILQQTVKQSNRGDKIKLGNYEWQILAIESNRALIITTGEVGERPYNEKFEEVTWETCTLRKWLNNGFYNEFSEVEKELIATSTILVDRVRTNSNLLEYRDVTVEDKIFLLSVSEAKQYFASNSERSIGVWWWLRSPGNASDSAASVDNFGDMYESGDSVDDISTCVRPALWINLES